LQKALHGPFAHLTDRRNLAFPEVDFMMESEYFSDLTHGLCSREHKPCNVPAIVMCPDYADGHESGGIDSFSAT
jgi:hypothetical protein